MADGREVRAGLVWPMVAALMIAGACNRAGDGDRDRASDTVVTSTPSTAPAPVSPGDPEAWTVVAAGDIACEPSRRVTSEQCQHAATAELAASLEPDVVVMPGDLQYDRGELDNFRASFGPTWGRFGDRLRPAPGNHEYSTRGAAGYFEYMGELGAPAGRPGEGWYRDRLGSWDLFVLNSTCEAIGGCGAGSVQLAWLRAELATTPVDCALAVWHHPRFSSGLHGDSPFMAPLFAALDEAGVELVVSGHDHSYERFAPLTAGGEASPDGVRQFVAGTGGRSLYPIATVRGFSEARNATRFGVLELELGRDAYGWRFVALDGEVLDEGRDTCR